MPSPEKMSLERREACRESQSGCPASRTRPSADCRAVRHSQECLQSSLCWRLCATSLTSWDVASARCVNSLTITSCPIPAAPSLACLQRKHGRRFDHDRGCMPSLMLSLDYSPTAIDQGAP